MKGTEISLFLTSLYGTRDPILYAPANKPIKIASRKHYKDMNLLSQTPRKSGECDNVTFSINLVYKNLARSSNALWVLWGASGVILCISGTAQSTFCTQRNSLGSLQHSSNTIWVPILSQMATFGHQMVVTSRRPPQPPCYSLPTGCNTLAAPTRHHVTAHPQAVTSRRPPQTPRYSLPPGCNTLAAPTSSHITAFQHAVTT